ncbi:MAG TPA: GreA/GreB family elongation factor [Geobacteraceae bacterium]|nr:GreA/GreB family elongation factor [Geobacteraceae bacterium]
MNKEQIRTQIVERLAADLDTIFRAARAAHEAATHEECLPDNKYDTTALEASYIAQGQANRAREIRLALESYRTLTLQEFSDITPVRLTALVELEDDDGNLRTVFLGPQAGGLRIACGDREVTVVTPRSPLGSSLLGKCVGDELEVDGDSSTRLFTILAIR